VPTGAEDFATFCAACHGLDGRGAGEVAATLAAAPADLTRLARGKDFPTARVMSKIYGYAEADTGMMPGFADLLAGETVLYDSGDGIATPTPLRLVQLAEHVRGLGG
jgi:mono/diheme cytochrome c family protein